MPSPANEPLVLSNDDKAKLSAYLNGATFSVDEQGRETFHPRIDSRDDNLKVVYMAEKTGVDTIDLDVSIGLRDGAGSYNLTDFVFDLVDYTDDHRVTAELTTRRTSRIARGLKCNKTYSIFPHGEDGGSEVRDPARFTPPSNFERATLPAVPQTGLVGAGAKK